MNPEQRIKIMTERLAQAFTPSHLTIQDDSALHRGHVGAQGGAGHYTVYIVAECFINQSPVDVHRQIYAVFADLIPDEIHALSIKLKPALDS